MIGSSLRKLAGRHVLAVAVLLGCLGCLRDPGVMIWEAEMVEADRMLRDGQAREALRAYRALHDTAPDLSDELEIKESIAESLAELGRGDEAIAMYLSAAKRAPGRQARARYLFRAARGTYDAPARQEEGLAMLIRLVDSFPDTVGGLRALQYVTEHFDGTEAGREWLLRFYRDRFHELRETPLADNLAYQAAAILMERETEAGTEEAAAILRDLIAAYPRSQHWDDGVWLLADAMHRTGRYEEEVRLLTEIIRRREKPAFFGNYEIKYFHRGQYRIAQVLRDCVADAQRATAAYRVFIEEYPFSRMYDDAMFELTALLVKQGQDEEARKLAARLREERPESRYVSRAEELVATGRDPGPAPLWTDPTEPYDYPRKAADGAGEAAGD